MSNDNKLASIATGDSARLAAAQLAVSWLVEALADNLCSSLSCATGSVSPSAQAVRLGSTLSIVRTVQDRCLTSLPSVNVGLWLQNTRTGLSTLILSDDLWPWWDPYQSTGTWQASGQAGDLIKVRLKASWQGQIWDLATDRVQLVAP